MTIVDKQVDETNQIKQKLRDQLQGLKSVLIKQKQITQSTFKNITQSEIRNEKQLYQLKQRNKSIKKRNMEYEQDIQLYNMNQAKVKQLKAPFLLQSKVLDYQKDQQQINFIQNSIQNYINKKIIGSRTLFYYQNKMIKYNNDYNWNFHHFIDNIPNTILLIHLQNGFKIGGFVQNSLRPAVQKEVQKQQKGIMFSITRKKCYQFKENQKNARVISYDQYYMIWGNSQMRIKMWDDIVYSNFGINRMFFDKTNDSLIDFIGSTQREIKYIRYEVIEVRFDDGQFGNDRQQKKIMRDADQKMNISKQMNK